MDGGAPRLTRGELNALLKEGFKGVDIKVEELKKKKDGQKKSKKNKK